MIEERKYIIKGAATHSIEFHCERIYFRKQRLTNDLDAEIPAATGKLRIKSESGDLDLTLLEGEYILCKKRFGTMIIMNDSLSAGVTRQHAELILTSDRCDFGRLPSE